MTIRDKASLDALFPDDALWETPTAITAAKLRDLLDSLLSVGGVLETSIGVDLPVTTSWAAVTIMDESRDTKGVSANLSLGELVVASGGGGWWKVNGWIYLTFPVSGWLELSLTHNGGLYGFAPRYQIEADVPALLSLPVNAGALVAGSRFGLGIRGQGSATATGARALVMGSR